MFLFEILKDAIPFLSVSHNDSVKNWGEEIIFDNAINTPLVPLTLTAFGHFMFVGKDHIGAAPRCS